MLRVVVLAAALTPLLSFGSASAANLAVTIEIREVPAGSQSVILSAGVDEQELNVAANPTTINLDLDFFDSSAYRAVVIQPKARGDLDAAIEVIVCSQDCKPLALYFPDIPNVIEPDQIARTCKNPASRLRDHFLRYFFCRAQYRIFEQQNNEEFEDAFISLFGWFEAAYKLNETMRYKGYPIFPRDRIVEDKIMTEAEKEGFRGAVGAQQSYFAGMIRNMESSERTKIQYVDYLKSIGRDDLAQKVLFEIGAAAATTPSVLQSPGGQDDVYVKGVFQRELPRVDICSLAGIC